MDPTEAPGTPAGPGYEALHTSVALFEDPDRVLLSIDGDRAVRMLNGLVSADLSKLHPDRSTLTFVLTSKGRPIAVPRVVAPAGALYLDASRAGAAGLLQHLSVFLPPRFAQARIVEGVVRASLIGPEWRAAAERCVDALSLPADWSERLDPEHVLHPTSEREASAALLFAVVRAEAEGDGLDLYLFEESARDARRALADAVTREGGARASAEEHEVWRIECGIPSYGIDITEENLPQETGLVERAVSFDKGCYTGQEVVARIQYRGHVNRHLRGLRWLGPAPVMVPPARSDLTADSRSAGTVTSACRSPRFGPIALAYVHRSCVVGDQLAAASGGEPGWRVCDIPFT